MTPQKQQSTYKEMRCSYCHKLLAKGIAKGIGNIEIKCNRCKTINQFN